MRKSSARVSTASYRLKFDFCVKTGEDGTCKHQHMGLKGKQCEVEQE